MSATCSWCCAMCTSSCFTALFDARLQMHVTPTNIFQQSKDMVSAKCLH